MKKIFFVLFLILTTQLFAEYVKRERYYGGNAYFGMPSWVQLSDISMDESALDKPFDKLPAMYATGIGTFSFDIENVENDDGDHVIKIKIPESHSIDFLNKTYSYLSVHSDGRVEYGDYENDYVNRPYVKVATTPEKYKNAIGKNVEWGFVSQKVGSDFDNFIVVNFGPFTYPTRSYYGHTKRLCSIQILIYQDGEVQVQYWYHIPPSSAYGNTTYKYQTEWMTPEYYDGYSSKLADMANNQLSKVALYSDKGLRYGWIAKALNEDYAVDITEAERGKGLHVQMKSEDADLGGIIAYDYSREHPVVGSFSGVNVVTSGYSSEDIDPIYGWYFDEYYSTFKANYPTIFKSNGLQTTNSDREVKEVSAYLGRSDFNYTWDAYRLNPNNKNNFTIRNSESLDYISAPAFKFQRAIVGYSQKTRLYDFYIKRIEYELAQPQSVQFLPYRGKYDFHVANGDGGVVDFPQIKGDVDPNPLYTKVYKLYRGEKINGTIVTAPGYLIDKISISSSQNDSKEFVVYEKDQLILKNALSLGFAIAKDKQEIIINGRMEQITHVVLTVSYKKCETRELAFVVPAMVKTETYTAPETSSENRINATAQIMDAFGGVAQEQVKINDGEYSVSSEYSNGLGQVTRIPMTFVHKSNSSDFEYVDMACEGCITAANAYYYKRSEAKQPVSDSDDDIDRPDAENNAFTEVKYFNGNLKKNGALSASAGVAKRSFTYNNDKYAQQWEMPASSIYDFVDVDDLNEETLLKIYATRNSNIKQNNFILRIQRNAEGKYFQEIFNTKGQKETSWLYDGNVEHINIYEYDAYGNLVRTYNKDHSQISQKTSYDAQGRVESIESSDRGKTQYRYDSKGRLRFVKTPLHNEGEFTAYFFDDLGRTIAEGEVSGLTAMSFENPDVKDNELEKYTRYTSKTIYGRPQKDSLTKLGVEDALIQSIVDEMKGIRANDVGAIISFDDNEQLVSAKLSEYNRIGEKKYQWIILNVDEKNIAVQLTYDYNLSGELTHSVFSEWNGSKWVDKATRTRKYDNQGRLIKTLENGAKLAGYVYTPNGNVREKMYYDNGILVYRKVIARDVYDRPVKISYYDSEKGGNLLYSTTLDFGSVETSQANKISHEWDSVDRDGVLSRDYTYEYDYSGRLTSVNGPLSGSYKYDVLGRLTNKNEGDTAINYIYYANSYRPTEIVITGERMNRDAFVQYDAAGNVWLDKHNFVTYRNNKRGVPTKITKFNAVPSGITFDMVQNSEEELPGADYSIDIAYDENGDRIWYSVNSSSEVNGYTRIALPGVGVYEAVKKDGVNGNFELVRQDLIAGGYRDAAGTAHYPLLDAQGNVRSYAKVTGIKSAYDYYAYGTVDEITNDNEDDNKRWQGKEYDGEHGKYFFGARYFDPFLGLWMSPDPAGQFANPYTYGGDPVNFVDPNGEFAISSVVIGLVVGAIIGGATSYSQCAGRDECWAEALRGAGVGGAAGAVGGAAGELVGTAATGAAGLTFGSGTAAAAIGGATEGAFAGMASSAIAYTLTADSWNFGAFYLNMLGGFTIGGVLGALKGAIQYDASAEYRESIIETVEKHGTSLKRYDDVVKFDLNESGVQRAINYVKSLRGYEGVDAKYVDKETLMKRKRFPSKKKVPKGTRGVFWEDKNHNPIIIEIYDEALAVDGVRDPTSLMAAVDHEYNHFLNNGVWVKIANANGYPSQPFVEASNYYDAWSRADELGYSDAVKNYLRGSIDRYLPENNMTARGMRCTIMSCY